MLQKKAMIDIAFDILTSRKTPLAFLKLYEKVAIISELDENQKKAKASQFYTDLSLDKRFTSLKNNRWDLTDRVKFSETYIHIDEHLIDLDDDEDEDNFEEINEEENRDLEDYEEDDDYEDIKRLKQEIEPNIDN